MSNKVAIFAFKGDPMCFAHALLNTLDMKDKGYDVKLVIEGTATQQVKELTDQGKPFADLYAKAKEQNLIDCVCRACSNKMETLSEAEAQGLPICDEMSGHPAMARYIEAGYQIVTL